MKFTIALLVALTAFTNAAGAETIPLYCNDLIVLTETAVQQRDAKFSKAKSLEYLGSDDFMSARDKKVVRQMIERVYAKPKEGLAYHIDQTKTDCGNKLSR